jgi:nitrilase
VTSSLHRGSRGPIRIEPDCAGEAIKLGEIGRGTCSLDVVGRYARPDAFRLSLDLRLKRALMVKSQPPSALVKESAVVANRTRMRHVRLDGV